MAERIPPALPQRGAELATDTWPFSGTVLHRQIKTRFTCRPQRLQLFIGLPCHAFAARRLENKLFCLICMFGPINS